jgi:hypothetical protein
MNKNEYQNLLESIMVTFKSQIEEAKGQEERPTKTKGEHWVDAIENNKFNLSSKNHEYSIGLLDQALNADGYNTDYASAIRDLHTHLINSGVDPNHEHMQSIKNSKSKSEIPGLK